MSLLARNASSWGQSSPKCDREHETFEDGGFPQEGIWWEDDAWFSCNFKSVVQRVRLSGMGLDRRPYGVLVS